MTKKKHQVQSNVTNSLPQLTWKSSKLMIHKEYKKYVWLAMIAIWFLQEEMEL